MIGAALHDKEIIMEWSEKVINLANKIESDIRQGRPEEALTSFKELRKLTHINPPPPYVPPPPPPGPHFGNRPLPDEDW